MLPEGYQAKPAIPLTADELRQRMGKRIRLMPDTEVLSAVGASRLASRTSMHAMSSDSMTTSSMNLCSGDRRLTTHFCPDWDQRGVELHRRLQRALGPDREIVFIPD